MVSLSFSLSLSVITMSASHPFTPVPPQLGYMSQSVRQARGASAGSHRAGSAGFVRPGTATSRTSSPARSNAASVELKRSLRAKTFLQDNQPSAVADATGAGGSSVAAAAPPPLEALLPQPLPRGIPYVATFTTYDDLIGRRILHQPEAQRVHLSTAEASKIFVAKCQDQNLKSSWNREVRFLELLANHCRGNTFALREAGLGSGSAQAVQQVLARNRRYTVVDLSGNRLRDGGASAMAQLVRENDAVVTLVLRSCDIGHVGAETIAEALATNTTLTYLDLGGMSAGAQRNHMGLQGARALSAAVKTNRVLFHLDVGCNGLGAEGVAVLASGIAGHVALSRLTLQSNGMGVDGAKVLATALQGSFLEVLDIRRNALEDKGAEFLSLAYLHTTDASGYLRELRLDENNIGVAGCTAVATMLGTNNTLQVLTLNRNPLTTGIKAIAEALKNNRKLVELQLLDTGMTAVDSTAIAAALAGGSTLIKLAIGENRIGDAGVLPIAEQVTSNRRLCQLDLHACGVALSGGLALAKALDSNKTLTHLDLKQNSISGSAGVALQEAMRLNTTMRFLDVSFNDIPFEAHVAITALLKRNKDAWEADAGPRLERDIEMLAYAQKELVQIDEDVAAERRSIADKHEEMRRRRETARGQAEMRLKTIEELQAELTTLTAAVDRLQVETVQVVEEKNNTIRVQKEQRASMLATKVELEKDRRERLSKDIEKLRRIQKAQQEEEAAQAKPLLESLKKADADRQAEYDSAKRQAEAAMQTEWNWRQQMRSLGLPTEAAAAFGSVAAGGEPDSAILGTTPRTSSAKKKK